VTNEHIIMTTEVVIGFTPEDGNYRIVTRDDDGDGWEFYDPQTQNGPDLAQVEKEAREIFGFGDGQRFRLVILA